MIYLKRLSIFLFIFFIVCLSIGYSQNNTNYEERYSDLGVTIRFYNKQTYYIGSPIIVEFQIVNRRIDPFLFITSYKKLFTFDFDIYTTTNRRVEHSKDYAIDMRHYEAVLSDEIALKDNEVYGVRINISEWFDFPASGDYIIRGIFYPKLITNPEQKIYSENELKLRLNPPYTEEVRAKERVEEIKKFKALSLPPYEVIDFTLTALMDKDFEKYFLYINFDRFIMQFVNARKKYVDAHDTDKPAVIEFFKKYLMGENNLETIPFSDTIPINYEIEETYIKKREAQVKVIETFKYINLIEKKRYTYFLHLYGDRWLIEQYAVVNIGR